MDVANAKAAAILIPRAESNLFGAQEERELKAEKFSLAVRVREMRLGAEQAKGIIAKGKFTSCGVIDGHSCDGLERLNIEQRRETLARRRTNLENGQSLLRMKSDLSAMDLHPSLLPPDSLAALDRTHEATIAKQVEIAERIESTRHILVREVLAVYGFSRSPPSHTPDRSITSSSKSSHSLTSASSSTLSIPATHQTHQLAQLPIPTLSSIHHFPATALAASLSHLLHLVRLLALYLEIKLPFTPLPSLFGPGRPGLRVAIGWGDTKLPSTYPLFPATTTLNRKGKSLASFPTVLTTTTGEQSGGREELSLVKEKERVDERLKLVVGGAVALAFDLAFIVWSRGGQVSLEETDDLGALLAKAVGIGTL